MDSTTTSWKENKLLEDDLRKYVLQNMRRKEILDYARRDYPSYSWSMPTLARRLSYFDIKYVNYDTPLDTVQDAVRKELLGPGKLLGYKTLNQKLRTEHNICVPRHLVYNVQRELDPEGMEERKVANKRKKAKIAFECDGPLSLVSLDGHDKLCGYQNWTFPLGVYGCIDTFSRKVLFLHVCFSNSNPSVIAKQYLQFLVEFKRLPVHMRMDRGTETGKMATLHAYLISKVGNLDNPIDAIIYGPSTTNKIERWWRDLHERLEMYFKIQLETLLRRKEYDPHNYLDRQLLAYVFIPVIQRECDIFVNTWNSHRIRKQENILLPTGIPNHIFEFPVNYGGEAKGFSLTNDDLEDAASAGDLLAEDTDFLSPELKQSCERILPNPEGIECNEMAMKFNFLKSNLHVSS